MKKLNLLLFIFGLLCVLVSCDNTSDNKQFTLLTSDKTGVDFINELKDRYINDDLTGNQRLTIFDIMRRDI